MSKGCSVQGITPLGTWRLGPKAAAPIEAGKTESAGDGLGESLHNVTEATDAVRAFVRCADCTAPRRIGSAGSAMRAAVAVGGIRESYHESVAVPP